MVQDLVSVLVSRVKAVNGYFITLSLGSTRQADQLTHVNIGIIACAVMHDKNKQYEYPSIPRVHQWPLLSMSENKSQLLGHFHSGGIILVDPPRANGATLIQLEIIVEKILVQSQEDTCLCVEEAP